MTKIVKQRLNSAMRLMLDRKMRKIATSSKDKENKDASASTATEPQEKRPETGDVANKETNTLG